MRRALVTLACVAALGAYIWLIVRSLTEPERPVAGPGGAFVEPPAATVPDRTVGVRVPVPPRALRVVDGDTVAITWKKGDVERVRILGIDAPETRNAGAGWRMDQPFAIEARDFARRAFREAGSVELLRAADRDQYGRTLGYLFLDGENYSVRLLSAGLAAETITRFGDNGFPAEAARVIDAARRSPPLRFEHPQEFRRRMREQAEREREAKAGAAVPALQP